MIGHHHPAQIRGVLQALGVFKATTHDPRKIQNLEPGNALVGHRGQQVNPVCVGKTPFA
jgi:hypothetical protein